MIYHFSNATYHVAAFMWILSYCSDPIVYIFLNHKSRDVLWFLLQQFSRRVSSDKDEFDEKRLSYVADRRRKTSAMLLAKKQESV